MKWERWGTLILVLSQLLSPATGRAAASSTVDPSQLDLQLKADAAGLDWPLKVTNNDTTPQAFTLSTVDFTASDQYGTLNFLDASSTDLQRKFGLANWLTFDQNQIVVPGGQTVNVNVHVRNDDKLSPGAHYAAILVTRGTAAALPGESPLRAVVGSLVFLMKDGEVHPGLNLTKFDQASDWWNKPQVKLTFENTGNSFIIPRGYLTVTDPRGQEVLRGLINENSDRILPGASREFPVNLESTGSSWLPGRYKLTVSYRYDGQDTYQTKEIIIYKSLTTLIGAGIILLFVVLLIGWFLWRHRHWSKLSKRRKASK